LKTAAESGSATYDAVTDVDDDTDVLAVLDSELDSDIDDETDGLHRTMRATTVTQHTPASAATTTGTYDDVGVRLEVTEAVADMDTLQQSTHRIVRQASRTRQSTTLTAPGSRRNGRTEHG
jgi:hypothetical protein